jgi:hypothetical protein
VPPTRVPTQGRLIIADHRKTYSEDDFAIILAKAAELSLESSSRDSEPGSLSLAEMKSIAKEVGLDPELIERAAHLVPGVTRPTLRTHIFGGPLSSRVDLLIPAPLTEDGAQQLLSLVRATLLTRGQGEATSTGMSFSSFEGWQKVFISADRDGDSTRIRVVVDNRSRLLLPIVLAPVGTLLVVALAVGVGPTGPSEPATVLPWLILGAGIPTVAGLLWRSVRKTVRRTLSTLDDLVGVLSSYTRHKDAS